MPVIIKVLGFSVALTLVFTLIANILPQVEGEAPVEITFDPGAFTEESFVALGEELFKGKGTCTLCHNNMGRAPDVLAMNMVDTATERLADTRYKGAATDAESYLRESLLQPTLYVVKGYGKKGSNDTESPMPTINKAPIQLSDIEMDALIAYMQAKDGNSVTVALPTVTSPPPVEDKTAPAATAVAKNAEEAINKYGCVTCHAILDSEATIGPNLRDVGTRLTVTEIRQSIVDPNTVIAEGYSPMMPNTYPEEMRFKELDMIVQFLSSQSNESRFVALGEELFKGKGGCILCHNSKGYAPNISAINMVEVAAERLADPSYQGQATNAESYLWESMLKPGRYVVKDYGKKGTNDTESLMPIINKGSIQLSSIEMNAVIAYMQAKDGNPVTVAIPAQVDAPIAVPAMAQNAEEAIHKFGCTICHSILESKASIGPDLRNVGARLSTNQIQLSIIDPDAVFAEGYTPMMSEKFAEKMRLKELKMIVQFLAAQGNDDEI